MNFDDDWGELSPDFDSRDHATDDLIALAQARAAAGDMVPVDVSTELMARGVDVSWII